MGTYTLVLFCDDDEQATAAEATLRTIIDRIVRWHVVHTFKSKKLFKGDKMVKPSPPEIETGTAHGFDWRAGQDWLAVDDMADAEGIISHLENTVFLTSGETESDPAPLITLAQSLAKTVVVDQADGQLTVTVTAQAPDTATATAIHTALQAYLDADGVAPVPWKIYSGGEALPESAEILALDAIYLQHLTALAQGTYEDTIHDLPELDMDDAMWLDDLRAAVALVDGHVKQDGTTIRGDSLVFEEIASGLPAVLAWMAAQGCTAITHTFHHSED